jgi:transposase-like protein
MKTTHKSDSQVMQILIQAGSGIPVSQLYREHGMSSTTFYKWRVKYGGILNDHQTQRVRGGEFSPQEDVCR